MLSASDPLVVLLAEFSAVLVRFHSGGSDNDQEGWAHKVAYNMAWAMFIKGAVQLWDFPSLSWKASTSQSWDLSEKWSTVGNLQELGAGMLHGNHFELLRGTRNSKPEAPGSRSYFRDVIASISDNKFGNMTLKINFQASKKGESV